LLIRVFGTFFYEAPPSSCFASASYAGWLSGYGPDSN